MVGNSPLAVVSMGADWGVSSTVLCESAGPAVGWSMVREGSEAPVGTSAWLSGRRRQRPVVASFDGMGSSFMAFSNPVALPRTGMHQLIKHTCEGLAHTWLSGNGFSHAAFEWDYHRCAICTSRPARRTIMIEFAREFPLRWA